MQKFPNFTIAVVQDFINNYIVYLSSQLRYLLLPGTKKVACLKKKTLKNKPLKDVTPTVSRLKGH